MEKKKILWIDDEINSPLLRPYVDEFEENNYEVIKVNRIDKLLPILKEEVEKSLSAILVDIIMPPMAFDFSKTRGGLRTGIVVLENILKEESLYNIPIIVVTNVDDTSVNSFCEDKSIPCLVKTKYYTDTFVEEINKIIRERSL